MRGQTLRFRAIATAVAEARGRDFPAIVVDQPGRLIAVHLTADGTRLLRVQFAFRPNIQRHVRVWASVAQPADDAWLAQLCRAGQHRADALLAELAALPVGGTLVLPRNLRSDYGCGHYWGCTWMIDLAAECSTQQLADFVLVAIDWIVACSHDDVLAAPCPGATALIGDRRFRTGAAAPSAPRAVGIAIDSCI